MKKEHGLTLTKAVTEGCAPYSSVRVLWRHIAAHFERCCSAGVITKPTVGKRSERQRKVKAEATAATESVAEEMARLRTAFAESE